MHVLLLDGASNAALAVLQSLGKAGYTVSVASHQSTYTARASRYAHEHIVMPNPHSDVAAYLKKIVELNDKRSFDWIIPCNDASIQALVETDTGLVNVLGPDKSSYELAFNKARTLKSAKELGIPIPQTCLIRSAEEFAEHEARLLDFPYFVKHTKARAYGTDGVALEPVVVRDAASLNKTVSKLLSVSSVIIQDKIEGYGVGIEVLCDQGEIVASLAHERIHELPLTGGGSSYRRTIDMPPELLEHSRNLLRAWKWHGVAMVEYKYNEKQFALMEVNGRFWGSLPLAIRAGIDFPKLLLDLLDGQPIQDQRYKVGVYSRHFMMDVLWMKANLKADTSNPDLLTQPKLKSIGEYFRVFLGTEFWDHVYLSDPKVFLSIVMTTVADEGRVVLSKLARKKELMGARKHTNKLLESLSEKEHVHIESVCYGNICRSPLVEYIINGKSLRSVSVSSSGFHQKVQRSSPAAYQCQVKEFGIDLRSHRSSKLTQEAIDKADLILLMNHENWLAMKSGFGEAVLKKCILLGSMTDGAIEIDDPYQKDRASVDVILKQLFEATDALLDVLGKNE